MNWTGPAQHFIRLSALVHFDCSNHGLASCADLCLGNRPNGYQNLLDCGIYFLATFLSEQGTALELCLYVSMSLADAGCDKSTVDTFAIPNDDGRI